MPFPSSSYYYYFYFCSHMKNLSCLLCAFFLCRERKKKKRRRAYSLAISSSPYMWYRQKERGCLVSCQYCALPSPPPYNTYCTVHIPKNRRGIAHSGSGHTHFPLGSYFAAALIYFFCLRFCFFPQSIFIVLMHAQCIQLESCINENACVPFWVT